MVIWIRVIFTIGLIWQIVALAKALNKGSVAYSGTVTKRGEPRFKYEIIYLVFRVLLFSVITFLSFL